jgi:plasmid maintenance system antidote protein VapI
MEFYNKTNRVSAAVGRQQDRIDKLVEGGRDLKGNPIGPSLKKLEKEMGLSASEHAAFQRQQSQAAAMGDINTDESLAVYNALGDYYNKANDGWAPGVGLATKVIVTQMVSELLARGGAKGPRASIGKKARQARPRKTKM